MQTYKSRISYGLMIFVLAVTFSPLLFPLLGAAPLNSIWIPGIIVVLTAAFILHILYNTYYTVTTNQRLKIHSGFIYRNEIDIRQIVSIRSTRSILASPAASFDRLEIRYGKYDSVLVSPEDKEGFVRTLWRINPKIATDVVELDSVVEANNN